jgi:hypothetical protein
MRQNQTHVSEYYQKQSKKYCPAMRFCFDMRGRGEKNHSCPNSKHEHNSWMAAPEAWEWRHGKVLRHDSFQDLRVAILPQASATFQVDQGTSHPIQ